MVRLLLQKMIGDLCYEDLPANWNSVETATFSGTKTLWDYQQQAVQNAIKFLWKYYEDFSDYSGTEDVAETATRKEMLYEWYKDNGLDRDLDIPADSEDIRLLLSDYYSFREGRVPYSNFINRMSFWMATGSGKTLVLVKLVEVLGRLIDLGEIPKHDILILTHRDDLIDQLKKHVDEFNAAHSEIYIRLRELREYADAKRDNPSLFKNGDITVFYYKSDNISDEQKEKLVDFRNYDDEGRWYVLLDEAHKGEREDSKRQQIYSILARNGLLFSFSATFTDSRDFVTTAFNFNLAEFTKAGYGKHIAVLKQELRAFRDKEDYNTREKRKVVLKSLMMLAYARLEYEQVLAIDDRLYHRPLMLTLVNSVNTEDADLKLFFRELEKIARGEVKPDVWQQAQAELWEELVEKPECLFVEDEHVEIDEASFRGLTQADLLRLVFNSEAPGDIEVMVRPSDKNELAFKLKTSDQPFAMIKIGDKADWQREMLAGYEFSERFEADTYFDRLNAEDSGINILMGSRSFYEGWDSNRPNVINYINIGMGTDAKKFILQSAGRGVRIEPLPGQRKRLDRLLNAGKITKKFFDAVGPQRKTLETLFIFATNHNAVESVISQLREEEEGDRMETLSLSVSPKAKEQVLLVPLYKDADHLIGEGRSLRKFELHDTELDVIQRYVKHISDDKVLMAIYGLTPGRLQLLQKCLTDPQKFFQPGEIRFSNLEVLMRQVVGYIGVHPQELDRLKSLEDEISHFRHISVAFQDFEEVCRKVLKVEEYPDRVQEIQDKYVTRVSKAKGATLEKLMREYGDKMKSLAEEEQYTRDSKTISIKHIAEHYYIPIVLAEDERVDYIKHIIRVPSEVLFVKRLETYLEQNGNKFEEFDWWLFSKLDESLDTVYIPYYDPRANKIRQHHPDFIFWLKKDNDYLVVFVDPKGTSHTDYMYKIDGYRAIYEKEGQPVTIRHEKNKVKVFSFMQTDDISQLPEKAYADYWFDNIDTVLCKVLSTI